MKNANHICKRSFITLTMAFSANSTWAVCTSQTTDGLSYYRAEVPAFGQVESFNPLAVPIGGVIFTTTGSVRFLNSRNPSNPPVSCRPAINIHVTGVGTHTNNIYPTSIPNIGIRLTASSRNERVPYTQTQSFSGNSWDGSFPMKMELIKTGEITAGGNFGGSILQYRANSGAGQLLVDFQMTVPIPIIPQVPTCRVSTTDIALDLGKASMPLFNNQGATFNEQEFKISLACQGGTQGTATKAYVTLTDVTNPANRTDLLSLTRASTATGVAIQITRLDTPLKFGEDSAAVGNPNQWFAGQAVYGQGTLDIPLKARYVQTAAMVRPGTANGSATFTMSYQ